MKTSLRQLRKSSQGSVAVEFAILLVTVLPLLIAAVLFFGRYFWHYSVAEKAARDTARFLAAASPAELKTSGSGGMPPIANAARSLGETEVAELNPGTYGATVSVFCDGLPCIASRPLPTVVTVWVTTSMEDPFLSEISKVFGSEDPLVLPIDASVSMSYVGN